MSQKCQSEGDPTDKTDESAASSEVTEGYMLRRWPSSPARKKGRPEWGSRV